ncbi:MAG: class I SAM-dependent methyltransferase [Brumimicrobium sp.]
MSKLKNIDWFESWFDTSYYHILYKHRDFKEAEKFISNLLDYLNLPENANCLDLACGKGRHSLFLNKHGLNVTGVDLSKNSIENAKLLEKKGLKFDVHDMRKVYKENEYDVVFNLFTSFGYFDTNEDNLKVLNSVFKMLKQNGLLIIDFMNVYNVVKKLVKSEQKEVDGIKFNIERNFDGSHIHKVIRFKDKSKDFEYIERVQALYFSDFKELLIKSGFLIKDVFGDFSLGKFDKENSKRLIIIAQKT